MRQLVVGFWRIVFVVMALLGLVQLPEETLTGTIALVGGLLGLVVTHILAVLLRQTNESGD